MKHNLGIAETTFFATMPCFCCCCTGTSKQLREAQSTFSRFTVHCLVSGYIDLQHPYATQFKHWALCTHPSKHLINYFQTIWPRKRRWKQDASLLVSPTWIRSQLFLILYVVHTLATCFNIDQIRLIIFTWLCLQPIQFSDKTDALLSDIHLWFGSCYILKHFPSGFSIPFLHRKNKTKTNCLLSLCLCHVFSLEVQNWPIYYMVFTSGLLWILPQTSNTEPEFWIKYHMSLQIMYRVSSRRWLYPAPGVSCRNSVIDCLYWSCYNNSH